MKRASESEIKLMMAAEKIDRDTIKIRQEINGVATQMICKVNEFIESSIIKAASVGSLTRLRHQINLELKERGLE